MEEAAEMDDDLREREAKNDARRSRRGRPMPMDKRKGSDRQQHGEAITDTISEEFKQPGFAKIDHHPFQCDLS